MSSRRRLLLTVTHGVLGVIVANGDMLVGCAVTDPAWRAFVVASVMALPDHRLLRQLEEARHLTEMLDPESIRIRSIP